MSTITLEPKVYVAGTHCGDYGYDPEAVGLDLQLKTQIQDTLKGMSTDISVSDFAEAVAQKTKDHMYGLRDIYQSICPDETVYTESAVSLPNSSLVFEFTSSIKAEPEAEPDCKIMAFA